jgi:hypothetical protein
MSLKALRTDVHESIFNPGYCPSPPEPQVNWSKHAKLLNVDPQKIQKQRPVKEWTPAHVSQFVQTLPGCSDKSNIFKQEVMSFQHVNWHSNKINRVCLGLPYQ